ncbi:Ig-like domain-containing protein [Nocardioides speluncae]|uniref:Ig-like domain-containing protein n=1 Tax=Nocardioides speluncae TaxID=2670337 RepID=UPI000D69EE35|nr:Ig-like domain-containing protein [Nocardioides speluncae]
MTATSMRRLLSAAVSTAVATTALTTGLTTTGLGTAAAHAAVTPTDDATLTWGLSGYAQKGIFGPWTFSDLTGNVTQLVGSVSGGTQTEYAVDPVPVTSMPANSGTQKTPNAVKFTAGAGTADPETGAADLSWTGSYTVNAYPPQFGAPDEIYSNPELDIAADGSGELTMNFALGEGVDMEGNPIPAQDFGRLTLLTFGAGSDAATPDGFRLTPGYQGVEVTVPDGSEQVRNCTPSETATGWWGSWPAEFVTTVPASVRPHFYSTGCGGMQDNKPPLPVDLDLGIEPVVETPTVTVSDTDLSPTGQHQVTIEGSGFDPATPLGTRPPLAGQPSGAYVIFGKFADTWRPSAGAPSSSRVAVTQKWAVPAAQMGTIGGPAAGAVELEPDGTFTATLTVDKAAADAASATGNYGIYTYAGSGAVHAPYETATPITFSKAQPTLKATATKGTFGTSAKVTATLSGAGATTATGTVTVKKGTSTLGSGTVTAGKATVTVSRLLAAGTHTLSVTYGGDAATEAATSTVRVTVAKAKPALTGKLLTKPTPTKAGKLQVQATSPAKVAPRGKVRVVLKNAAGKVLKNVTPALSGGRATVSLPKLKPGRYRVVLTYAGDSNHAAASPRTLSFSVTH